MISKKLMTPALAGTGAVGASGTLAWTLGLFDGETLEDVEDGKVENLNGSPDPSSSENKDAKPQPEAVGGDTRGSEKTVSPVGVPGNKKPQTNDYVRAKVASRKVEGADATSQYFINGPASDDDKQVVKSNLTWNAEWKSGQEQSLWVNAEETNFSWKCRLKPITFNIIDTDKDSYSEFERQGKDLIKAIKTSSIHKEKFVENCSKSRAPQGAYGLIELETEKIGKKVRFKESGEYFQNLWTQDFTGMDKLRNDDKYLEEVRKEKWNIEEIKEEGKTKKLKISPIENRNNWFCNISGSFKGNLGTRKFREEEFRDDILNLSYKHGYQNEIEKKRYLIRNCRKNEMNIKGLTVRTRGSGEWEFGDLEKITGRMYENPTTT